MLAGERLRRLTARPPCAHQLGPLCRAHPHARELASSHSPAEGRRFVHRIRNFAGLYSLVGSCIVNGVEPTEYLTDVVARVRGATSDEQLDALLPDRWQALGPAP